MNKNLLITLLFLCLTSQIVAQEYHFQEGFIKSIPDGWIRNCSGTNSLTHGLYEGNYAAKFDKDNHGEDKQLESPAVNGAGTLTFWVSKNANAVYFDLHVCKIVNGEKTELGKIVYTDQTRTPDWTEITVEINDPSDNIKIMIWAEDAGVSTGFVALDDIALTIYENQGGGEEPEIRTAYEKIITDFSDGTWGEIASALPTSSSYPTDTINDFILNKAVVYTGSTTDQSGEKHVNRIGIDKKTNGGNLELPWLKTVGQLEIHAAVGTAGNTFTVDEYVNKEWVALQTYSAIKSDSTFYLNIERNDTTRLRISNNSGGSVVIWKVLTRSLSEVKELNVFNTIPAENAVCFYNLTKELIISFNKDIEFGNGILLLNETEIPLSVCIIEESTITIPVELESNQGTNKAYKLTIPAGAFVDKNDATNFNNEFTLNFETLRKPNLPTNYAEIIDIQYSEASADMCRMDFYYPADAPSPTPVIINMHGGGWNHGAKEEQTGFGTFTGMGFAIANVEYRMTPQATAPAAVEDVRCAMHYLLNNATTLNIDTERIVFQGASAGGHLALTAAYLQNNRMYDSCDEYEKEIKIFAVIDKYGPASLKDFMFYTSLVNWLGEYADDEEFINSISPVELVNENTPPTYIVHGDEDPTVPYNQSLALEEKLKEYKIHHQFTTIPGGKHGGFESQYNTQISQEIKEFLTELMKPDSVKEVVYTENLFQPYLEGNTLFFNSNEEALFEVYDLQGNKLMATTRKSIQLNQSGVFIIKANNENKTVTAKIIK